jgi:hypothetical protein
MAPSTEGEEKLASLAHPDIARAATATEATQTGPAPATAPEAARSVAFQLAASAQAVREGGVEINLSPEELGKVTLALHVSEGAVVLAIQAERPDTLDLIRRHIDVLERELRDAGYDSLSFSFGQGTADGRAAGNSAYSAVLEDRAATGIPAPDTNPRPAAQSSHNRLDLRL